MRLLPVDRYSTVPDRLDGNNYNPKRFRPGTCSRCGRYGCEADSCQEYEDYWGNAVPDNWDEHASYEPVQ